MRFPLALLATLLLLAPAFAQKAYKSDEGKYEVRFPKEPTVTNKELATTAGVLKVQTAKYESGKDYVLSVSHTTYPPKFGDIDAAKILDGVRDGLKGQDGTVKVDEPRTLGDDKVPARDVRIEAGKNGIRSRLILVDRRLVQVMAAGSKEALDGKAVEEFFKSFELMK